MAGEGSLEQLIAPFTLAQLETPSGAIAPPPPGADLQQFEIARTQLMLWRLQPPPSPMSLFANAFLPPGDSAARCVEFLTAKTACDWTVEWSCPGSSNPGRSGLAGDDGSLAFFCCCKVVFPAELQHQRLAQEWNALVTHEHAVEGDYRGQE